ncbi:sodium-independent sulfate anion transporter-like isoform X2 [Euwallacea fornicatus]|uniref:sodium-independent sulfate anion transporter-like isoform X2 n=1 Tax=Euwallacea fornicatus TaxID=995702 RepID=UPI00338D4882
MASGKNNQHGMSDDSDKRERDLQGESEGGRNMFAYENPTLSLSEDNLKDRSHSSDFQGSTDFIINDQNQNESTVSKLKKTVPWIKEKARKKCTKKTLYKRLPILGWLPKYDKTCVIGDILAGITVGLMVIPQGLAYSGIAGLPTQYGLYTSFLGAIVYIFFGSCKDVPMGPTAISALLTNQAVDGKGPEHAILLCFLTGSVQLVMGIFGLGFLIDFISGPVSSGFTSAVALIILTSQVKDILGIAAAGSVFTQIWRNIFQDIHNTNPWDAILGFACIIILLVIRVAGQFKVGPSKGELTGLQMVINKFIWLFATARNAIIVVVCGFIGYSFYANGESPFTLIGAVPEGLPSVQPPPFGYTKDLENGTQIYIGFWDMVSNLSTGIIVTPLIGLLETIAICKAFADGKPVDATQELVAIGLSNIANSFVQSFPGAGALARSAVNNSSGVKTPMGGLYTGLLVIFALLFFTPYFYYIPKAALAAIIIAAVIFMVEVKVVKPMWRTKKSDFFLALATFIACLVLPLEIGIIIGIGLNLLFILYHAARPKISVETLKTRDNVDYLILTPDRCLIFPSTDYVRNLVTKQSIKQGMPVVIDCSHIYGADYTAALVVGSLTKDFATRNQPLFFYNLKPSVCAVFEGLSPTDFVVYYDHDQLDDLLKKRNAKINEANMV